MLFAAGSRGRPGKVIISPQIGKTNSAPADSRTSRTLMTVSRQHAAGPPAAEVTDALAGRAPAAAVLAPLPACTRTALSHLADFFTAPVDQSPAGETRDPINDDRSPAHHGNTQLEPVAHARHLPATPEEEQRA